MQMLLVLASNVCAILPMVAFLAAVWWLDRYDREPVWLIALTFLWGAVGAIVLSVVGSAVLATALGVGVGFGAAVTGAEVDWLTASLGPVVVAPLVEEPAKALILLAIMWNRHFDNMTDGFVYGAAAGLGFGMTENLLYFVVSSGDLVAWSGTVLVRTFYSAVMHATATAIVGAALGFARFRGTLTLTVCGLLGLALATGVHALWNGLLTGEQLIDAHGALMSLNLVLFPFEVLTTFVVFQLCLLEESATIRRELAEEADAGRIPEHHPSIVSSWTRRLRGGWLPPGVDRDAYVQAATSLAMRKKQVRQMGDRAPRFYLDEVERLRRRLVSVLAT